MQTNGLYNSSYEHDACGVGMVVNIHGGKSHQLVDDALKVLENLRHRGAEGADGKTGDGAGILLQIPHEFILLQGIPVPEKGKYGTGLIFLPKDEKRQQEILSIMIEEIEREGLQLMHLRTVPTNPDCLGEAAAESEPAIKQVFITGVSDDKVPVFERMLYIIRKKIERRVQDKDFYICSLSSKNIVYKGMLSSLQLRQYYPDLTNSYFTSGLALVHSRFSTNTFPTWSLAQPFRLLAHNGEINTIRGNRSWMKAREAVLSSDALGDIHDISPIIQPNMSDSASLDNVFEFFVMNGMSLPKALSIMVPESFNDKNPISEDIKAFYEYHSILMEPWDGPAALLFSDGRYAGGMLDRNGLRPARYTITKDGIMVVASEVGVMDFDPTVIAEKGRLQPGKILLIDTQEGKIYYDGEIKDRLAHEHPYHQWLNTNRIQLEKIHTGRKVSNAVENLEAKEMEFGFGEEDALGRIPDFQIADLPIGTGDIQDTFFLRLIGTELCRMCRVLAADDDMIIRRTACRCFKYAPFPAGSRVLINAAFEDDFISCADVRECCFQLCGSRDINLMRIICRIRNECHCFTCEQGSNQSCDHFFAHHDSSFSGAGMSVLIFSLYMIICENARKPENFLS